MSFMEDLLSLNLSLSMEQRPPLLLPPEEKTVLISFKSVKAVHSKHHHLLWWVTTHIPRTKITKFVLEYFWIGLFPSYTERHPSFSHPRRKSCSVINSLKESALCLPLSPPLKPLSVMSLTAKLFLQQSLCPIPRRLDSSRNGSLRVVS